MLFDPLSKSGLNSTVCENRSKKSHFLTLRMRDFRILQVYFSNLQVHLGVLFEFTSVLFEFTSVVFEFTSVIFEFIHV